MNKRKIPILSKVLYVLAGLLIIYALWGLTHSMNYISEMVSQGQLVVSGSEYDIISYFMSSNGQYALFAVIIFALGWIIQKSYYSSLRKPHTENQKSPSKTIPEKDEKDDDFEDWFKNNDN